MKQSSKSNAIRKHSLPSTVFFFQNNLTASCPRHLVLYYLASRYISTSESWSEEKKKGAFKVTIPHFRKQIGARLTAIIWPTRAGTCWSIPPTLDLWKRSGRCYIDPWCTTGTKLLDFHLPGPADRCGTTARRRNCGEPN